MRLAANEIGDIATGNRAIYLYGEIDYRDIFGKHRFSNFRLRYLGQYPPPPQGGLFNFSESGNDATYCAATKSSTLSGIPRSKRLKTFSLAT